MTRRSEVAIIGAGPAGLFAAERLALAGVDVLVIDGGKEMAWRKCPKSWACACEVCDILEGEGGAGGFSDGKKTYSLTRGTQLEELFPAEAEPILWEIDETILAYTSSPGVWVDPPTDPPGSLDLRKFDVSAYPLRHIGSDGVREFIVNYREYLEQLGVDFMWRSPVTRVLRGKGLSDPHMIEILWTEFVEAERVMIATGLQGWTWVESLMSWWRVPLLDGPASIGMRYEAPAEFFEPLVEWFYDYKLQQGNLRSFCCNHRGQVINENHRTLGVRNVNGDSFLDPELRTGMSNLAILAKLNNKAPVRGLARHINEAADGQTIVQRSSDFQAGTPTVDPPSERTNIQSRWGVDISALLPDKLRGQFLRYVHDLEEALSIPRGAGIIYAPEAKYAGRAVPVTKAFQLKHPEVRHVYVIGNATGVIDSFVAAALSGVIAANHLIGGYRDA